MGGDEVISLSFAVDCLSSGISQTHWMIAGQIVIVLLSKMIAQCISTFTRRGAVDTHRLEHIAEENRDGSHCHRLQRGTAGWLRS